MGPRTLEPTDLLSREDIAKMEIGQTEVSPVVAVRLCAAFLLLVCVVPVFELSRATGGDSAARAPWARLAAIPQRASSRDGIFGTNRAVLEGLHEFEELLEDESRLGQSMRPGAQQLLAGLLGAGNEQAYAGRNGWLFYRPDVEYVTTRGFLQDDVRARRIQSAPEWTTPPQPDPRVAIMQLHRDLAARGIALIVMPVPVKPVVHPDLLAAGYSRASGPPQNPDYGRLLDELRRAGVVVFEPTGVLEQAARTSGATQYLATDTHWRPEAMELVVDRLAETVRQTVRLPAPRIPHPAFRIEAADVTNRGDIFGMLDLPTGQSLFPAETVTVRTVVQADGAPWKSSPDADVLVLGDSFANIYSLESMGWGTGGGLVEHLSYALRRPVDRMVQNDAGSYATREMLSRADDGRLEPKRVVIYQFAARELAFGDWKLLTIADR